MSFEEFLAWADEDTYAEWVDGEVVMMSAASTRHQRIVMFLGALFQHYVEAHPLGTVLIAPFLMRLPRAAREPDVLFVARDREERIRSAYLDGPADLVVEVVSPDSRRRDRQEKLREYGEAGVREYWVIDPDTREAQFHRLTAAGEYASIPVEEGVVRSDVLPGLWIRVEWLWQEPLPPLMGVLKEWGLV
jgi:Uma2 family endonuclease